MGIFDEPEHQRALSLRYETRPHWEALRDRIGTNETGAAVAFALYSAPDEWISYSRTRQHYDNQPRRYRHPLYTFRRVPASVDLLDQLGLIEHDKRPPGQRGWQSAMQGRPELRSIIDALLPKRSALRIAMPREGIILRAADGSLLDYADNRETRRMRRSLEEINEAIRGADLALGIAAPMVRIFNQTMDRGGRFYAMGGGWQNMKKEARAAVQIGGEPVVEIDYRTLHPAILYAQAGATLPADAYAVGRWPRRLVKIGLLVLINAKTRHAARLAIANHATIREVAEPGSQEAIKAADRLIDDIKRAHAPIARAFHSDAGARLMHLDSALAETVMHLMLRQGVVVLPVHDSFLVPASKADELEEAMLKAAHEAGIWAIQTDRKSVQPKP